MRQNLQLAQWQGSVQHGYSGGIDPALHQIQYKAFCHIRASEHATGSRSVKATGSKHSAIKTDPQSLWHSGPAPEGLEYGHAAKRLQASEAAQGTDSCGLLAQIDV